MKTIQKPKRMWQKKKDYNKKKLIRKIQRRNKTSFDGGKDESYSDLKTNRPIIIGPGLLSVITPNPEKYKKGKDCFDIGTDDAIGIYRGTLEQHNNPNQLWEREKPLDEVVVTPKGYYPNMQSYIAATHGSAYDPNAPFEMFNQLVFNSVPSLYDTAYQGVTGEYGKQGASTPAQDAMGYIYKRIAPSRWLGSAKKLLSNGELIAPWSDNNSGLTGDPNLDGVFDALVLHGVGNSTRFNNLKNTVVDKTIQTIKNQPYRLKIPIDRDLYYRIVDGDDAINDANNSGMVSRMFAPDYQFPYFTKGDLYSNQNPSFKFLNPRVIVSKSGQKFHYVKDGLHEVDGKRNINVGDSATPVIENEIGTAYNSAPVENFTYWKKGNGPISKYFWKKHEFSPFSNIEEYDHSKYGEYIADGSESWVYTNPANKYSVLKEYSGGFKNNLPGMRNELIRRNSVPGAMPTKIVGITKEGYPVLEQGKVSVGNPLNWETSLKSDLNKLFLNSGYKYGLEKMVPNNGKYKIIDLNPYNVGYDQNGNLRIIDSYPDKLTSEDKFNPGKDIHIKKANRGKFTKAANEHNMGVQEFARQVLSAPKGKYSSTLRKRANFARNFAH